MNPWADPVCGLEEEDRLGTLKDEEDSDNDDGLDPFDSWARDGNFTHPRVSEKYALVDLSAVGLSVPENAYEIQVQVDDSGGVLVSSGVFLWGYNPTGTFSAQYYDWTQVYSPEQLNDEIDLSTDNFALLTTGFDSFYAIPSLTRGGMIFFDYGMGGALVRASYPGNLEPELTDLGFNRFELSFSTVGSVQPSGSIVDYDELKLILSDRLFVGLGPAKGVSPIYHVFCLN